MTKLMEMNTEVCEMTEGEVAHKAEEDDSSTSYGRVVAEGAEAGREGISPLMKCMYWNISGLLDEQRRGTVGRYPRDWGTTLYDYKRLFWRPLWHEN